MKKNGSPRQKSQFSKFLPNRAILCLFFLSEPWFHSEIISTLLSNQEYGSAFYAAITQEMLVLASCPWGPATAHGVGMLTELYVIYRKSSP